MAHNPTDDLFESSKMTFGEHLEELRGALFRAVIGLALGTCVGLYYADSVVQWIEYPLRNALDEFYSQRSIGELERDHKALDADLKKRISNEKLTFERRFIERRQLRSLLADSHPSDPPRESLSSPPGPQSEQSPAPPAQSIAEGEGEGGVPNLDDLVPIDLWVVQENRISALAVTEAFMIWMKAGFVAGFLLASPWVFYQIWGFVAAGLYPHEKNYVYTFFPISMGLFLAGAALAYFFVFSVVLQFLFSFNLMVRIDPEPRISEWLGFVLLLPIGFGISFQLPLLMFVLERIGVVTVSLYLEKWRIAVLAIFVVSMILTPAEPTSMLMMAIPLTFLYFIGVGMCRWMPRRKNPYGEVADAK